jgi:hypothetical protein
MMKSVHQALSLFCVFTVTGIAGLSTPLGADDSKVPQGLLGLWAHSEADCRAKLSGQLDRDDRGNGQNAEYELVGFCKNGMDLLYQPIFCAADKVEMSGSNYNFSGRCRVKDYPVANLAFKIRPSAANGLSFDEKDFGNSDFAISGDYVRCMPDYKCVGDLDGN